MIENSFGKDLDIITKIDMQIVEEPKKYVDYAEIDPFDLKYQLVYKDNEFAGIINEELMLKNANIEYYEYILNSLENSGCILDRYEFFAGEGIIKVKNTIDIEYKCEKCSNKKKIYSPKINNKFYCIHEFGKEIEKNYEKYDLY